MDNRFILTPFFLDEEIPGLVDLYSSGWDINQPLLGDGEKIKRMSELHQPLVNLIGEAVTREERPVSLAGDCCATIGVLAGLQHAGIHPTLIWFDAHGDFNTWETSPSGFLGGMPLAMLVGRGDQSLLEAVDLTPLPEEKVILTDARDLDPEEGEAVEGSAMRHISQVTNLLDAVLPDGPLYVHFDTDVLNPEDASAMSYPAEGGPSADDLREVFRHISGTGRVVAASLSSWNPSLEGAEPTQEICMNLFNELVA